jgi:uncharacterized protein YeaO (DUF488 family)
VRHVIPLSRLHRKRVYDAASSADGTRFLVERLWPRGIKKSSLKLDGWLKDAAPSTKLRQWFSHDPAKWIQFQRRYFAELDTRPQTLEPILNALRSGPATLIFSSHDEVHNNAVALKTYIADHDTRRRRR